MISGCNIICLASSWEIDPTSKHQVMRLLARDNRVLWVNYHGSRLPRLNRRDAVRAFEVVRGAVRGASRAANGVTTMTPFLLPVPGSSAIRGINRKLIVSQVRRAMRDWPKRPVQLWSFAPDVGDLVGEFDSELVVYYCVDEFGEFAEYDRELIRRLERELIARSDLVLTSSQRLYESKRVLHPNTHLIRHGVDAELFGRALNERTPIPQFLHDLPRPVVGYFGLIHDWFDLELLGHVADLRPEWSFVLVGGISCDVSSLRNRSNVVLTGRVEQGELPGYCRGFDVATIPFVINELTLNVNPIKLREYLAAGLGVVATPLPEVRGYEPHVLIADSPERFVSGCERIMSSNSAEQRRARARSVAHESWEERVREISDLVVAVRQNGAVAATRG